MLQKPHLRGRCRGTLREREERTEFPGNILCENVEKTLEILTTFLSTLFSKFFFLQVRFSQRNGLQLKKKECFRFRNLEEE